MRSGAIAGVGRYKHLREQRLKHPSPGAHQAVVVEAELGLAGKPVAHAKEDQRADEQEGERFRVDVGEPRAYRLGEGPGRCPHTPRGEQARSLTHDSVAHGDRR